MSQTPIEIVEHEGVLTITLRRAQKKNALTSLMYEAMIEAFARADADANIGALLLRGSEGIFTAGNDIGDFIACAQAPGKMAAWRFVESLATLQTPLVAAIAGPAIGIGATLILHCDLVYAAPDALFKMPFVDLGLVPEAGASLLLPQRIGMAKASEFLMLGASFDATQAHSLGLVNDILPQADLDTYAFAQAKALARKPRGALRATRRLLRGDSTALVTRIAEEGAAFVQALQSGEAQAAFSAFMARGKA